MVWQVAMFSNASSHASFAHAGDAEDVGKHASRQEGKQVERGSMRRRGTARRAAEAGTTLF